MITIHQTPCAQHPSKRMVSRAELAALRNVKYQRKMDGEFATITFQSGTPGAGGIEAVLAVETMKSRSGAFATMSDTENHRRYGTWHCVLDILALNGVDIRNEPLRLRWAQLAAVAPLFQRSDALFIVDNGTGSEFIAKCLDDGAEGVVAKDLDQPYGEMACFKRGVICECLVTRKDSSLSVGIKDAVTGVNRGNVKLGMNVDRVQIGSRIRVEGLCLTDAGMIREPRACREWLVSV